MAVSAGCALLLAASAVSAAEFDDCESRYFGTVQATFVDFDDRAVSGQTGSGLRLGLGRQNCSADTGAFWELAASWNSVEDTGSNADDQLGLMAHRMQHLGAERFRMYWQAGAGIQREDLFSTTGFYPAVELGLGMRIPLGMAGVSLRIDAAVQGVYNDDALTGDDFHHDGRLSFGLSFPTRPPPQSHSAQRVSVISLQGDARLNGEPLAADYSSPLPPAAELTTGPNSVINLRVQDGTTLQLAQNTRLQVKELSATPDSKRFKSDFKLDAGEIIRKIPKSSSSIERQDRLVTPSVTIGVRGTEYVAGVDSGKARTMVNRGRVALSTSLGGSLPLEENFGTVTVSGQAPEPPSELPPPPPPLQPENAATVSTAAIRFEWDSLEQASAYLLELADDGEAFNSVVVQRESQDSHLTLAALPYDAAFRWRVSTADARGLRGRGSAPRILNYRYHHARLRDLLDEGDAKQALLHADAALKGFPDDPKVLADVGRARFDLGQFGESERDLARALALAQDPEVAVLRARAQHQLGNLDTARLGFNAVLADYPANANALAGLAEVELSKDELDSSEQHFKSALAIQASHPRANLGLARLLVVRGDLRQAHHYVDLHLKLKPEDPEALELHQHVR